MSKPNKQLKDSKQFTVVFENFAQKLIGDGLTTIERLGIVGNRRMYTYIKKRTNNAIDYVDMYFIHWKRDDEEEEEGEDKIARVEGEIVAVVEGKDPIVKRLKKGCTLPSGLGLGFKHWQELNTILDESNGYLKDGALTVHVEIRIDCLIGKDGIRMFNFYDPFENSLAITLTSRDGSDTLLYTPKTLFLAHCVWEVEMESDSMVPQSDYRSPADFERFLQLVHGVRLEDITHGELREIISIANMFRAKNVLRFCEEWMIRNKPILNNFQPLTCTHSNCLLKWFLRHESYQRVRFIAEVCEPWAKGEHMKAIAKRMFSEKPKYKVYYNQF